MLLLLLPRRDRDIRVFALVVTLLDFVLRCICRFTFIATRPGFQFEIDQPWITNPNIHYHMGIDGISMWLVVLTTFLTPFAC